MADDPRSAGIDRPPSIWGDNPRLRNIILIAVGALILICAVTTVWLIEDYWRAACQVVLDRARFEPARDGKGRAIPSTYMLAVRWQLPEE